MRRAHLAPMLVGMLASIGSMLSETWRKQGLPRNADQRREAREYRERGAADRIARAEAKRARKAAKRLAQTTTPTRRIAA